MTSPDAPDAPDDERLDAHLRRTLDAAAATVDPDDPAPLAPPGVDAGGIGPVCGTAQRWIETMDRPPVAAPGPVTADTDAEAGDGDDEDGHEPRHRAAGGRGRGRGRGRGQGPATKRMVVAGVGAAVVLAGIAVLVLRPSGSDPDGAWGAEAVAVAEAAPRLLVTADGWTVTAADEFAVEHGETTSTGPEGRGELTLMWTADVDDPGYLTYDETLADLTENAERLPDTTVAGHDTAVFQTDPAPLFFALWQDGDYSVGVTGGFATVDDFLAVVRTIDVVSVDGWLSAMPARVVQPGSPAGTVDEMLADVPLPAGFDRSALVDDTETDVDETETDADDADRLGTQVAGAVACAWYDQWFEATVAGDSAGAAEAADAMGTSPSWPVLLTMAADGDDWPQAVWNLADAMAAAGTATAGAGSAAAELAATAVCS